MSKRMIFAELINCMQTMETDMGLKGLTHTDRQVLSSMVLISKDGKHPVLLNELKSHTLTKNVPIPSLFRSLRGLMQRGLVQKIGTERSATYTLV